MGINSQPQWHRHNSKNTRSGSFKDLCHDALEEALEYNRAVISEEELFEDEMFDEVLGQGRSDKVWEANEKGPLTESNLSTESVCDSPCCSEYTSTSTFLQTTFDDSFGGCSSASSVPSPIESMLCRRPTRWEQAVVRAAEAAKTYVRKTSSPAEENVRKTRSRAESAFQTFHRIQSNFLRNHSKSIMMSLATVMGHPISLLPVPLAHEVQERFVESCCKFPGRIIPVFHGTHESNKESIFRRGLLIPSAENELKVVHGSAHGLGIYAADLSSPQTAMHYSSNRHLLVCAMLVETDDASIKTGNGFFVVFDHYRIAPLFEACGQGLPTNPMHQALWTTQIPQVKSVTRRKRMKARGGNRRRLHAVQFLLRQAACKRRP